MSATQRMDSSLGEPLFIALELGQRTWKFAFSIEPARYRTMTDTSLVAILAANNPQERQISGVPVGAPTETSFLVHRLAASSGFRRGAESRFL